MGFGLKGAYRAVAIAGLAPFKPKPLNEWFQGPALGGSRAAPWPRLLTFPRAGGTVAAHPRCRPTRGEQRMSGAEITADIPARIDRLPWSNFHLLVVVALGVT